MNFHNDRWQYFYILIFFHPFNFCLCIRRQCLIICRLIFWFLFTLIASRQNKGRGNSISSLYCLSPFCSCAVGNPCAWRQICSMASELGAGDDGGCTELAKPLYLQYLERALRLDHFLRQTSAIFNRNISRYGIPSSQCNVLPQFWFPLFL